jgi:hypothetical protein
MMIMMVEHFENELKTDDEKDVLEVWNQIDNVE